MLWSSARLEEGVLRGFWALSGRKIRSGWQKRTRSHFAIFAGCGILLPTSFQPSKGGDMVCARGPLGACVATLCNHSDKEGSISVPGIDPSCDLRSKTQSLTNIENDLYQRKTAILIPRYSAVWVVSSTRQPNQRQGGLATPRATKKTRITRVAIATAPSSRGRTGWYLDG